MEPGVELDKKVESYHQTGFMILKGMFTPEETKGWLAECDRLAADKTFLNPLNIRTPFRSGAVNVPERIDPVIDVSPVFAKLVKDPRLTIPVAKIFGHEPHLFKDKIIYKAPGVQGYPMHQDGSWWQGLGIPMEGLLSVMIAIDASDKANGCLEVFPGYHRKLLSTVNETRNMTEAEAKVIDRSTVHYVEAQPGDVVIFHALTPHQSGPNTASYSRKQFYLTYSSGAYENGYEKHRKHYLDYSRASRSKEEQEKIYFK